MSKQKEFHRPDNWSKAHQLLKRSDVQTIPLTLGPRPTALHEISAEAIVDLEKLNLNYIKLEDDGYVHIGALTTLQDLYLSDLIISQANGLLSEAAYYSATLGLRNLASLAGAITNPENPPDIALALMALDAIVTVQKNEKETREVTIHDWMKDCSDVLLPGEVIQQVRFSAQPTSLADLVRINRTPRDKAIVAAAAVLQIENNTCVKAIIALAGANPTPVRLEEAEALLIGKSLSEGLFNEIANLAENQAQPIENYLGSASYRKAMAGVLTKRVLTQALKGKI